MDIIQLFSLLRARKVSAEAVWPLKCHVEDAVLMASSRLVHSKDILGGTLWLMVVLRA